MMTFIENIEVTDLIPTHILTRSELNEWEAANILKASRKYLSRRKLPIITIEWLKKVHKTMFDETWDWAGKLRRCNFNLGVDWHNIQDEAKLLVDDINYWRNNATGIELIEQSVKIHHRLVKIHPFVNGNGRHARLIADIYLFTNGQKLPEWPEADLIDRSNVRKDYIQSLQEADKGNYDELMKFTERFMK